jgi:hypothetical protein
MLNLRSAELLVHDLKDGLSRFPWKRNTTIRFSGKMVSGESHSPHHVSWNRLVYEIPYLLKSWTRQHHRQWRTVVCLDHMEDIAA